MKFVFVHHAHRAKGNPKSQDDDITLLGEQDAKVVAMLFAEGQEKGANIQAIFTSPFKRCMKTAKIINEKINVPICEEPRFNEVRSVPGETWIEFQNRMRSAIYDLVCKYDDEDMVVCVTSGANVIAFMQLVFKLKPSEDAPFVQIPSCSPLIFEITKENFV